MGRKIRLTESEFHRLVKRLVRETKEKMDDEMDDEMDHMDYNSHSNDDGDLSKEDTIHVIAKFFRKKLRRLDDEEIEDLADVVDNEKVEDLTEMFLREDISDRKKTFKEKLMMRGGLGMMGAGALGMISQAMGYIDQGDLMTQIHDVVQAAGGGAVSTAMVFAGLLLALKGRVNYDTRVGN